MTTNNITRPAQKQVICILQRQRPLIISLYDMYSFQSGLEAQHQCIETLDFVPNGFPHNLLLTSFLENHQISDMKSL